MSRIASRNNHSLSWNNEPSQKRLISPVGKTVYLPLTNDDLIYNGNLDRYKNNEFKLVLMKVTRDLNMLLHFTDQDFWAEIQHSVSLRKCLESCLQIFPKKSYGIYLDKASQEMWNCSIPTAVAETHQTFRHLMRIVLFIYYRMVYNSGHQ
jgi:hypothetical protein